MGLLEKLFGRTKWSIDAAPSGSYWRTLAGYSHVYTTFAGSLYEQAIVRRAIDARATHISKLDVKFIGESHRRLSAAMTNGPNSFMSWSQFLYRLSTILDMANSAIILPLTDEYGEISGFFPVFFSSLDVVLDEHDTPWVRFRMKDGKVGAAEVSRIGIMTRFQYTDDFFGESNSALLPVIQLIDLQRQAIEQSVRENGNFRFIARANNFVKDSDLAKERERLVEANFRNNTSGLLLFNNQYTDIQQIKSSPYVVDNEQMRMIEKNVYDYFGVSANVLQNAAIGDELNAFYEGAVEPFAVQLSQVLTKMVYTKEETAEGAGVIASAQKMQYMSAKDKLNFASQMADRGIMNRNEIRAMLQLPPIPGDAGNAYTMRGEYKVTDENGDESKGE